MKIKIYLKLIFNNKFWLFVKQIEILNNMIMKGFE